MRTLLCLMLCLGVAPQASVSPTVSTVSTVSTVDSRVAVAAAACPPVTADTAADFFDRAVPGQLTQNKVPGAVVSVVSGDSTVFSRGYGLADVEDHVPFDPDRSLVRIASITKTFTWTAVMQQVQAGRLDLNADVNQYLTAFKIPATYPQPITLLDLMNHTAGFEDRVVGTAARTAGDVAPLERYLATNMPARIRPPGEISAYSNYGAALAGYIVAKVSGQPYDQYVEQHLFQPLGMNHSTATEPVPASLAPDMARSYDSDNGLERIPFEFDPLTPDGSISTTADDMAHFMAAQLNDGGPILSPATTALMHQRTYAADPRLNGYAHGFMDKMINGHHVLTHDGSWEGFESVMLLVPGCQFGLFISANATGGIDAVIHILNLFYDRFMPNPASPDVAVSATTAAGHLAAPRAGFYEPARHNESTVEKVVNLLSPLRLVVDPDGTVHFKNKTWRPAGNGLYEAVDGSDHLVFLAGIGGRRYAATDGPTYQLMNQTESLPFNLVVLLVIAVVALSALVAAVIGLFRRGRPVLVGWRWARRLGNASVLVGLAFLVGLGAVLFGDTSGFLYGYPLGFRLLLVLPVLAIALGLAALALTGLAWRRSGSSVTARVHQIVVLVGLAAFTWFVAQWNLF